MSRRTSQATSRASFKTPPVPRDPNMKETVISFNIKGGQNLSATKVKIKLDLKKGGFVVFSKSTKCPLEVMKIFFGSINYLKLLPILTLAGKATNKLSTLISLKMAERSVAKSAKQSFASKIKIKGVLTRNFASRF